MGLVLLRRQEEEHVVLELEEDELDMVELQVWIRAGEISENLQNSKIKIVVYEASMSPILKQR